MNVERISFADSPEKINESAIDCLWVLLAEREAPRPLSSRALQWVDWRLHGILSRYLLRPRNGEHCTTFVPTMKKLGFPLVAIEQADADWKTFQRNCEGMKMKDVLVFCEDESRAASLEKELRKHSVSEYPQRVMFGFEGASRGVSEKSAEKG